MRGIRVLAAQSPAIVLSLLALAFSLGGGAYAATAVATARASAASPRAEAAAVQFHALGLVHGWRSGQGGLLKTGAPRYAISGGVVYLTGVIYQQKTGNPVFAGLPRAARPAQNLFMTVTVNLSGAITTGTLLIQSDGEMSVFATDQADAADSTSLAGVSFPVGS
jgi:hypothetical protein